MSVIDHAKHLEKLAINNSPTVLTAVGVAGVIGTAVLTHKAATMSEQYVSSLPVNIDRKRRFELTWKFYIPPVAAGGLTIAAVVGSNRIGSRRAAAVAAAYTIAEKSYTEYREKVVEKFGEGKERAMRDELAQDRVNRNPMGSQMVLVGDGDVLCCEMYTGRYFRSSVEEIKKAMNDTNYQINNTGTASLTDFYDRIGLDKTAMSDEMGWESDKLLEIEFTSVLNDEGKPCVAFNYQVTPVRDYYRTGTRQGVQL